MEKVLIHYFSGTGNTYHMVKVLGNKLISLGHEVTYQNIEQNHNRNMQKYSRHVFCYPIYAFGTPAIVLKYIKKLEKVKGCKTAIICSCGGFEGQSLPHMSRLLKAKGYDVFLTDIGVYPDNWTQFFKPASEGEQKALFSAADQKVSQLVENICQIKESKLKRNIFNLAWSWIVFFIFKLIGRRLLGKTFVADNSCTSCGKCEKTCPSKSIKLKGGRPRWDWRCENCQRCMNICPSKSIQTSVFRLGLFIAIEIGMIFLAILFTNLWDLGAIVGILMYVVLNVVGCILVDLILYLLEKNPKYNKVLAKSFTKKYESYYIKS